MTHSKQHIAQSPENLLVDIQELRWGFPKSANFIFDKFNFKLYKNDFCFILGKSWVGKTTLTKFLIRQLSVPKKMIFYKKEDISRFTSSEVQWYRRRIWVIYQDYKLIDRKTVSENITYPLEIAWYKENKIKLKLDDMLEKMELKDRKDAMVPSLSWWEKQRVSIARALIANPEFIIADEPTWNLDRETAERIVDVLIDLNKQWNTIIFITHDLELINYARNQHNVRIIKLW